MPDSWARPRQTVETVPIQDIKLRIGALNRMGIEVVAITIDRERDQFWLITQKSG